ncbi:hypothetical protein DER46DRAFT_39296 [Fusarium sp. MPI-SDFR-AT-0072]|nr:hypothetical protein DER46DRAFT_39296 [Fusarium sp. MPI-SDFR-AT-0072]
MSCFIVLVELSLLGTLWLKSLMQSRLVRSSRRQRLDSGRCLSWIRSPYVCPSKRSSVQDSSQHSGHKPLVLLAKRLETVCHSNQLSLAVSLKIWNKTDRISTTAQSRRGPNSCLVYNPRYLSCSSWSCSLSDMGKKEINKR